MPILLNKISTKGGRGGQKSPKSCLRRIRTAPYDHNDEFHLLIYPYMDRRTVGLKDS